MEDDPLHAEDIERLRERVWVESQKFWADYEESMREIWRSSFNTIFVELLTQVLRPIPPAWARKPRTYGAYKRMVIRRIGA